MQHPVTRRTGGIVVIAGAVALATAMALHPTQPTTLAEVRAMDAMWGVSHWLIALAAVLWLGGAVVLARQFNGTKTEAWATLAYASAALSAVALFAVAAIETFGFHSLATGALYAHAEAGFTGVSHVMMGLAAMGFLAYFAAVALFGVAMALGDGWPTWLGWSGVAVGLLAAAVSLARPEGGVAIASSVLGLLWVAVAGFTLMRMGAPAPAEAERPVTAGM